VIPTMRIQAFDGLPETARQAALGIQQRLVQKPDLLLCAASGASTAPVYGALAQSTSESDVGSLRIVQLDEWVNLPADSPASCRESIRQDLLKPLNIPDSRYFGFDPHADPRAEVERMAAVLAREGPIDTCVLGLGRNGHLGFNEPAEHLTPHCHVAELSSASRQHEMVSNVAATPTSGMTYGMADILNARYIQLVITGAGKEVVTQELLGGRVTTRLPATFLWLHPNVDCYLTLPSTRAGSASAGSA